MNVSKLARCIECFLNHPDSSQNVGLVNSLQEVLRMGECNIRKVMRRSVYQIQVDRSHLRDISRVSLPRGYVLYGALINATFAIAGSNVKQCRALRNAFCHFKKKKNNNIFQFKMKTANPGFLPRFFGAVWSSCSSFLNLLLLYSYKKRSQLIVEFSYIFRLTENLVYWGLAE